MKKIQSFVLKIRKNSFLNTLFVGFSLVFIWRGSWGILDLFLPSGDFWGYALCVAIGIALLLLDDFRIDEIKR